MKNRTKIGSGRDKSRPYKLSTAHCSLLTLLLCLLLSGCGGLPPISLPAQYACVALPAAGGAAVVDITPGAEKLLGYVRAGKLGGESVACAGGRMYIANRDNGNVFVYDIAEALGNNGIEPVAEANSAGLKNVILIDASIGGLAWDKGRGLLYIISHTTQEGPQFDLLTVAQGARKLTSLALPANMSGVTIPQLSGDGSRLYTPAPAAGLLLTVQVGDNYAVLGSTPLKAQAPYIVNPDGSVTALASLPAPLNLPGAQYVAFNADRSRVYVSYSDGLAIVNMTSGKLERTIKLAGGLPAQVVISD